MAADSLVMAAPMIAVPESVKAAQLASIENLGNRLQNSKPEEICSVEVEVPEAFSCAVCQDLFIKPRQCVPCGHSFCESCLRELGNSDIHKDADHCPCPLCRGPIHYTRPNMSLEAEILRSPLANLYAERSESYAHNLEIQAKSLPGLAWLNLLPRISPGYRRINRVLSFITFALLWLSTTSTGSLLLDWFLLRTRESWMVLFLLSYAACMICGISMVARIIVLDRSAPPQIRFVELGADYCSARRMLPDTCPVPHFPDPLQVRVEGIDYALRVEVYVCVALLVFLICALCGPLLRYGGFRRLGNAISFVCVFGTCACALFSLLRCLSELFALVELIFRY